jgi:hypothetical protein
MDPTKHTTFSTTSKTLDTDTQSWKNSGKQPSPQPSVTELSHHRVPSNASQDAVPPAKDGPQWVTGTKLAALSFLVAAAMFLIMLDTSIIATAVSAVLTNTLKPDTN